MVLKSSKIFQGLPELQLERLALETREMPTTEGQWLFREGQEGRNLFLLQEGAVEFILEVDETFLPIYVLRTPGDCFGTSALIHPHKYSISARCLAKGKLIVFERTGLQKLMDEDREFGRTIMTNLAEYLLARLNETRRELVILFRNMFRADH